MNFSNDNNKNHINGVIGSENSLNNSIEENNIEVSDNSENNSFVDDEEDCNDILDQLLDYNLKRNTPLFDRILHNNNFNNYSDLIIKLINDKSKKRSRVS